VVGDPPVRSRTSATASRRLSRVPAAKVACQALVLSTGARMCVMNIFFDVDETLIAYSGSLRPGARSVIERLVSDGHHVYIWSGRGIRTSEVHRSGLGELVSGVYQKPLDDFGAGLARCGIPVRPDFVIDDYPGIVEYFGGLCIRPYHGGAQADDELSDLPDLVRGLQAADPRQAAAPPRPGPSRSWPCRCAHGRCTIFWGL
jgi:hypothetical protein